MNVLRCTRLAYVSALCLLLVSLLFIFPADSRALSVVSLGDYDNISVLEVSGDFNAFTPAGQVNDAPRQAVAREFYRTHGDDYDFLVLFTGFDFAMPPGSLAFYLPVKNDVEGIGQDLFDQTSNYSADGAFLERLGGIIDMGPAAKHVLEPSDPAFDTTLLVMTHEMLHRWGAYVRFLDHGVVSDALLGSGNAHWSFLLDADGSSLYGNHWQDNGNGTFTSIPPEEAQAGSFIGRVLSPLDRYLMGLASKDDVPPLRLLDSPGIDRSRQPTVGVTIPGLMREIGIEQIIAAEGERFPAATDAARKFRMAFIYLVAPNTWDPASPVAQQQLAGIKSLQREWSTRFAILSDGSASVQTEFVTPIEVEGNPGLDDYPVNPSQAPSVVKGVDWLLAQQNTNGFWQDQTGTAVRDTAAAVAALQPFPAGAAKALTGSAWLSVATAENHDFLARQLLVQTAGDVALLQAAQNSDGGWGGGPGYRSSPLDTALALLALTRHGVVATTTIDTAVNFLHTRQNPDGGWSSGYGDSLIQPTVYALLALNHYRQNPLYTLEPAMADGIDWLMARQNGDGGFGNSPSTVYDTALSLRVLKTCGAAPGGTSAAVDYLLAAQSSTGSWHGSVFQTALAVEALFVGTMQTDLKVEDVDLSVEPFPINSIPADVTLSAQVWNHGDATIPEVRLVVYQGDPSLGVLVGQKDVSIVGNSFTQVEFPLHLASAGELEYFVIVDPDDLIAEVSDNNNHASTTFSAGIEPKVGFALSSSSGPESQASVSIDVVLDHAWNQPVSIDIGIDASGTSSAGSDYLMTHAPLIFTPGETRKAVVITIVNDLLPENNETILLVLSNPVNATLGLNRTTYTILNDDAPPVVGFVLTGGSGFEEVGSVGVTVGLSHAYPLEVNVDYAIDTAAGNATPGEDVLLAAGTLRIPAGETSATFSLSIVNDKLIEPNESFVVRLSQPSEAVLGNAVFTYTIIDNDALPQITIVSPVNGTSYTDRQPVLQYDTNMVDDRVAVIVNDSPVATRHGDLLGSLANGTHSVRVVATNDNQAVAEDTVSFVVDDTGQPPTLVWKNLLQGLYAGGKSYDCVQYGSDGSIYAARSVEYQPQTLVKFDQGGATLWTASFADGSTCMDAVARDETFVMLGSNNLVQWYADGSALSGAMVHQMSVPSYSMSYWASLAIDDATNYALVGMTSEGLPKNSVDDQSNIQVALVDAAGNLLWRRVVATAATDTAVDVKFDSAGNIYVAGHTAGRLVDDNNAGDTDVFLLKYDPSGNRLWSRHWGTPQADLATEIALDSVGNVILAGTTFGSFDGVAPNSLSRAFLVKVGPDGADHWLLQDNAINAGQALAVTPDDDVLIAGWSGVERYGYSVNLDVTWSQYAADGGLVWQGIVDTGALSYNERVDDLMIDPHGNIFIATQYSFENYSTMRWESRGFLAKYNRGFELSPPQLSLRPPVYDPRTTTLKLAGLSSPWAQLEIQTESPASAEVQVGVPATRWTGTVRDLGPGSHSLAVVATSANGQETRREIVLDLAKPHAYEQLSVSQFGTTQHELPLVSSVSSQGEIFLAGTVVAPDHVSRQAAIWKTGIDGTPSLFALAGTGVEDGPVGLALDAAGAVYLAWTAGNDAFVAKFDAGGQMVWSGTYSSRKGRQVAAAIAVDGEGNVFLAGSTDDSPDRGVVHGGGQDYFLAKYDRNGKYLWSKLAGPGHSGDQFAYSLAVDDNGNVFLGGASRGAIHGAVSANSPFVARFNNDGHLLWVSVIQSDRTGAVKKLALDSGGYIYALGQVDEQNGQNNEILLAALTSVGKVSWMDTLGDALTDHPRHIEVDSDGNLLVAGLLNKSLHDNINQCNILWAKYSSDGKVLWTERVPASNTDDAAGIHALPGRGLVVTGVTNRQLAAVHYGAGDIFLRTYQPVDGPWLTVDDVPSPTSSTMVYVSGVASAGGAVEVRIDAPVSSTATVGEISLDPISNRWSCMVSGLTPNATNILRVIASDITGSISKSLEIVVDTLPPVLVVDAVPLTTDLPSVVVTGAVEGGALLMVSVNPSATGDVVQEVGGVWSHRVALLEGENIIVFSAKDDLGNESLVSLRINRLPAPPPSISVSPTSLQQDVAANVTLELVNIAEVGASFYVTMIYDVTGNGLSLDDVSVRKFYLQDGIASGDSNVPGDEDGLVNGRVRTTLNFSYDYDVQKAPGRYLFKVLLSGITSVAPFVVTESGHIQVISGYVTDESNNTIAGARVQLFDKWQNNYGYAYADGAGHYVMRVPLPGEYSLIPSSRKHAFEKSRLTQHLLAQGQSLEVNLQMVSGSQDFAGFFRDAATSSIMTGGNHVRLENDQFLAEAYDLTHVITTTDNVFRFIASIPPGVYTYFADAYNVRGGYTQGYLGHKSAVGTSQWGIDILLEKTTEQVCGQVLDQAAMGVAGVVLQARSDAGLGAFSTAVTGLDGRYCLGISAAGPWEINLEDRACQALGYVGNSFGSITAESEPIDGINLSVAIIDSWIAGVVREDGGQPVGGLPIVLRHAVTGAVVGGETAADGTYRVGAFAGEWSVWPDAEARGYGPRVDEFVVLTEGQTVALDIAVTRTPASVELTVDQPSSPTDSDWLTITGTVSAGAVVAVSVDTAALVGSVNSTGGTNWECTISALESGTNTISVTADYGTSTVNKNVTIDYRPVPKSNTIVITSATYHSKKKTLTVYATSDLGAAAALELAGAGPLSWNGRQARWERVETGVTVKPDAVTVYGPEGSVTLPVN